MNKSYIAKLLVTSLATAVLFLCGCEDDGGDSSEPNVTGDSIRILSVNPSANLVDGALTEFQVSVEYGLATKPRGVLMIGFNNVSVKSYRMISSADHIVSPGSGQHVFHVSAIAKDWGDAGDFKAYVNLSEYPHGRPWIPLATNTRVLSLQ